MKSYQKFIEDMLQIHLIMAKAKTMATGENYNNVIKKSTSSSLPTGSTYHSWGGGEKSTNFI
jgi:hypothetical protein